MASAAPRHGRNEPEVEPRPIIVRKITAEHRHVHPYITKNQKRREYAPDVTAA